MALLLISLLTAWTAVVALAMINLGLPGGGQYDAFDDTYGDLCTLSTSHTTTAQRHCMAHLIAYDGHTYAATLSQCFIVMKNAMTDPASITFDDKSKSWYFDGVINLQCGKSPKQFTITSSKDNNAVYLPSDYKFDKLSDHKKQGPLSGFALVKIGRELIDQIIAEEKVTWFFASIDKLSNTAFPDTCKCEGRRSLDRDGLVTSATFSASASSSGGCQNAAEDKAWKTSSVWADLECMKMKHAETPASLRGCDENGFCGELQSTFCYCRVDSYDEAMGPKYFALHSVGMQLVTERPAQFGGKDPADYGYSIKVTQLVQLLKDTHEKMGDAVGPVALTNQEYEKLSKQIQERLEDNIDGQAAEAQIRKQLVDKSNEKALQIALKKRRKLLEDWYCKEITAKQLGATSLFTEVRDAAWASIREDIKNDRIKTKILPHDQVAKLANRIEKLICPGMNAVLDATLNVAVDALQQSDNKVLQDLKKGVVYPGACVAIGATRLLDRLFGNKGSNLIHPRARASGAFLGGLVGVALAPVTGPIGAATGAVKSIKAKLTTDKRVPIKQ